MMDEVAEGNGEKTRIVTWILTTPPVPKTKRCRSIKSNATCHSSSSLLQMASLTGTAISMSLNKTLVPAGTRFSNPNSVSLSIKGTTFPSITMQPRVPGFRVKCAAKPDTVEKVCNIVKKQLALPEYSCVTGESKFAALGADSLDTVEIVMGLEEEFGISVEEESAQSITTVQEAADMIEKLLKTTKKTEKNA